MKRIIWLCLLCFTGRLWAGAAGEEVKDRPADFMLWHFLPAEGATPELALKQEKKIRALLQEKIGSRLMDEMLMDGLLLAEGNEKFLRCGLGALCLAELGRAAGVKRVASGEVALDKGWLTVKLVLVDVAAARVMMQTRLSGFGELGPSSREELLVALLEPEKYHGSLEINGGEAGAEVFLDGSKVGVLPLVGPLSGLSVGEHLLEVQKAGFLPLRQTVVVAYGKSKTVAVKMQRLADEKRFWQKWYFWTAAAGGVAALAIGGGLAYDGKVLRDNADACRREGAACADDYDKRADSRLVQSTVMFGLGGVGLVGAGIILVLDVMEHRQAPGAKSGISLLPAGSRGATLCLTVSF
jgi:hypothetical protein